MLASPLQGWYLFCAGLAAGVAILALTGYAALSPRWMKWAVIAAGLFTLSRYVAMAACALVPNAASSWVVQRCWLGASVGLTLPTVVALDQLVRHPAMSPKKLLQRVAPFLAGYAIVLAFGAFDAQPDPLLGARPHLVGWAAILLAIIHACFVLGFLALSFLIIRKLPVRRIQAAIAGLMLAQLSLGADGALEHLRLWSFRPLLFPELLALLAIWWALRTAESSNT